MAEQTASSLYRQQCIQSKTPVDVNAKPVPEDKHKTKFCLLCDSQYCSANDNAKNNWGDAVNMNFNDVKFFCTLFDLPDVHTRDKLPLCVICVGLMSKLVGYKEQAQQIQALFDRLHLQLTTRAIKTCRKYNYNEVRPVNTTVQHIRRNVYRRWNREIGDTTGPTKIFSDEPPKLEPQKPENRRKSRLMPRTTISASSIYHRPAPPQLPVSTFISAGVTTKVLPKLLPRPNPNPEQPAPYKATIRHNITANVNPPHLEEMQSREISPNHDPTTVDTEMLENGSCSDFQLDDIAIIEVQGAAPKVINYIDVDDDEPSPDDLPVDNSTDLPENENSEKQEYNNDLDNDNSVDTEKDVETPETPKTIQISHSIFEDNAEDNIEDNTEENVEDNTEENVEDNAEENVEDNTEETEELNLNVSSLVNVKLEESESEADEQITQNVNLNNASATDEHEEKGNDGASGTDEHEEKGNGLRSSTRLRRKTTTPTVVTSPRIGARKRKPTLRAVEGSEVMSLITKRRRKTSETGTTSNSPKRAPKETVPDPEPESEPVADAEVPENEANEASEDDEDKPNIPSRSATPTMVLKDGVQQFACDHCDKTFKSKERYREHVDMHAGQAPVCKVCNKTFPRKYNLNIHMRTHTGEKPHQCRVCGQAYADKSNLNAHLRKHVDKPWNCILCRKMYDQKAHALKHAENIHPNESADEIITTSQEVYADYSDCGD